MEISLRDFRFEQRKKAMEFIEMTKHQECLNMQDVRYLCEQGVPAVEIAVKNIPIECFKKGVEKWLDGLGK